MDLYQLKAFFYLAQIKNYSKCAERLFVTQSAISHSIKKLEESVGHKLINKRGKTFSLTKEGSILFKTCEKVFYEIESVQEILQEKEDKGSIVRIGSQVEFGLSILIKQIKEFHEKNPTVHVDYQFKHELLPLLMSDELDLMIDCKHHLSPELLHYTLFREEYVVVASNSYRKSKNIKEPKDLSCANILSIDKAGSWWNNFNHSFPAKEQIEFHEVTEINHVRGIITAAKFSLGVAFVPKYSVLKELKNAELINLFPNIHFKEDYFRLYIKKRRAHILKIKRLVDFLRDIKPSEFS